MRKIEFYRHNISRKEIKAVNKVLRSLFLTTGPMTAEFEKRFAEYLKVKHVLGVTSATAGLFLLLKAYDIKKGDEVITTPLSFVATANTIVHCGGKPVFVDVEKDTGNLNLNLIEEKITDKTKAIMPVHLYGVMVDMNKLKVIADKYNLNVIEDSAHCIEGENNGIGPGQLSGGASFSFYTTKNITSGEGGAVAINNDEIAEKIRILRLHGMTLNAADRYTKKFIQYDVPYAGYKFNMFDIQAALLFNQLKEINNIWKKKKENYDYYCSRLKNIPEVNIPSIPDNTKHSLHLFTILVDPVKRDDIINHLQDRGIGTAVNFKPIHLMQYYRETFNYKEGMFPEAERIGASTISLPFYAKLKKKEINYIVEVLKQTL